MCDHRRFVWQLDRRSLGCELNELAVEANYNSDEGFERDREGETNACQYVHFNVAKETCVAIGQSKARKGYSGGCSLLVSSVW